MSEVDKNIVEEVKDYLGVTNEKSNLELLRLLKEKMASLHPDNHINEPKQYEYYNKEFKKVNDLAQKLKKLIEQQSKNVTSSELVTVASKKNEDIQLAEISDEITALNTRQQLADEITRLRDENHSFSLDIEQLKLENSKLKKEKSESELKAIKTEKLDLTEMFKTRVVKNSFGIGSLIFGLASLIPNISTFLTSNLGGAGTFIQVLLALIAVLWIIEVFLSKIQVNAINNIIARFTNRSKVKDLVPIQTIVTNSHNNSKGITQSSLEKAVYAELNKKSNNIIFAFKKDAVVNLITNNILTTYTHNDIFFYTKSHEYDKIFFTKSDNDIIGFF